MPTVFLTDGRTYLGPYDTDTEVMPILRGTRTLREVYKAVEVHRVQAATLEQARQVYASGTR